MAADRLLAEPLADGVGRVDGSIRGQLRLDDLHQRHQGGRVEEMHADDPLGSGDCGCDLGDGERRRVGRQNRIRSDDPFELREERVLGVELLDDRLDDEVTVRQRGKLRVERKSLERRLALVGGHPLLVDLPLEEVRDPIPSLLAELVGHLATDGLVARFDRQLRDTGTHGAEADDADRADLGSAHDAPA